MLMLCQGKLKSAANLKNRRISDADKVAAEGAGKDKKDCIIQ